MAVSLWAVTACSQTAQPAPRRAVPQAVREQVQDGRFGDVTSIRGLPLGVRDALQTLFGSTTLDIAEPGADFQLTAGEGPSRPTRRLAAAGCTAEFCLVYYERGGAAHTWHVALFHWTPATTSFEWGGTAPVGLSSFEEVRKAVLAGAIGEPSGPW